MARQSFERRIQYPRHEDRAWDIPHAGLHARATARLVDLNPRRKGGYLLFDCPACCCEKAHAIRVALPEGSREMERLTLAGVIDIGCWRGRIVAGGILP